MLDQLAALRWVQHNIGVFGGDAHSVTLFGEDSGAAAASMLALSPLSHGLFHRVIALSGNALCPQYLQRKPRLGFLDLAAQLGCSVANDTDRIVDCMRKVPVQDVVVKSNSMYVSDCRCYDLLIHFIHLRIQVLYIMLFKCS